MVAARALTSRASLSHVALRSSSSTTCATSSRRLLSSSALRLREEAALRPTTSDEAAAAPAASSSSSSSSLPTAPRAAPQHAVFVPGNNPPLRPYARYRPELPQPPSYKLPLFLLATFSILTWSAFTLHATNAERLSSSVLKNVVDEIQTNPKVRQALGDDVALKREMILGGDPWIRGSVNMMQGRVDMSFKLVGSKDGGRAYFSAIRRDAHAPYETLRFLIVRDSDKQAISLLERV